MAPKSWPELPPRLPIKLEPASNGELVPGPLDARTARVIRRAHDIAADAARAVGCSRRELLESTCGAAAVMLALNELGCGGGRYDVPGEASRDRAAADAALGGDQLVFDVQTHHVSADRRWWESDQPTLADFLKTTEKARCGRPSWVDCFARDAFLKDVFLDSDTHLAVLSALWGSEKINAIAADEAALTRDRMAAMEGAPRLRIHGIVLPLVHTGSQLDDSMQALAETWDVAAWKLYPVWGPQGVGYRLDRAPGTQVIERAVALGRPVIAVHKGVPLMGQDRAFSSCLDVGAAARLYPRATFLVYHAGWEPGRIEKAYDPTAEFGVDALIRSCKEHGIGPTGNVYAELGSVWRALMADPDQAGHLLGKLLAHLGEDRILWGTDSIWYGSPQDQIQAFRAFQISAQLQEQHGYPALTAQAKAKILGLNAARVYGVDTAEVRRALAWDRTARAKAVYQESPEPSHQTRGPRTRRELLNLMRLNGGLPG